MGLLAAVQFLTRVPVRRSTRPDLAAAVLWFPVVGALVGAVVGGTAAGLGELVPMPVAAAVAVLLGVLITGAFHEDGLADTADAVAGGWTRRAAAGDPRGPAPRQLRRRRARAARSCCASSPSRRSAPAAAFAGLVAAHALGRGAAVVADGRRARWPAPTASAPTTPARSDRDGPSPAASWPSPSPPRRPAGGPARWRSPPPSAPLAVVARRRAGPRRDHRRRPRRHRAGRRVPRARRRSPGWRAATTLWWA